MQNAAYTLGRTPAKREARDIVYACVYYFGSWNNAISAAGLAPNRSHNQRMYRRVMTQAKDGHRCDSISEALIDNWLTDHGIAHERDVAYPVTRHKADWKIGEIFVEYFGLAKDSARYDRATKEKQALCKKLGITLLALYPDDIYPALRLVKRLRSVL